MPKIRPFNAVRYNQDKIKDLSKVVAPPYDVISPREQNELYKKDANNIVRIILGKIRKTDSAGDNRYTRAAFSFKKWLASGVLVRDRKPSIYIYAQKYKYNGKTINRIGFISLIGLDLGKEIKILPHENTLAAPKTDRLNLTRATGANLSPIFVLYEDRSRKVASIMRDFISANDPAIDVDSEGVNHKVWILEDPRDIKIIEDVLSSTDVFIADGHHRYEVARMYAHEIQKKKAPAERLASSKYTIAYFVESDEKMLTVFPAHRAIKNTDELSGPDMLAKLRAYFSVKKISGLKKMMSGLDALKEYHAFGMYAGGKDFYILTLKDIRISDSAIKGKPKEWKRLDVSILHQFIMKNVLGISDDDDNVEFFKSPEEACGLVRRGNFKVVFFLNPTKARQVREIAGIGERMPRKATYFYPKPLSGLVINKH